ncbi:MAG: hypothetical protein IPG01_13235 [Chitinophagaceae bacterium]|nr:hypothetical protein [Chitinophagaceae bacterium]
MANSEFNNMDNRKYEILLRNKHGLQEELNNHLTKFKWKVGNIIQAQTNEYVGSYIECHPSQGSIVTSESFQLQEEVDMQEQLINGVESCIEKAPIEIADDLQVELERFQNNKGPLFFDL